MVNEQLSQVGPRLRAARQRLNWTLEELAERAGMSVSTLSRLESGKRQSSLELLLPLTRQLGISIDELVRERAPDPRVRRQAYRRNGILIVPLAPESSPVHTYKMTYPPRKKAPEQGVHPGFEWLYVVSGKIQLLLGDEELVLASGEAAEFDTTIPHSVSAAGSRPAEVISIFNREGAKFHTHGAEQADESDHE
ncbi:MULTISPECIES: helix-turn-helix domain-containing protein [Micrococcaceae]|uniref:helix-turn-helix domain-containing protein n=1 Tax=unclassified Kocuria TaxID=2649579 RepID=UPI00352FF1C3